MVLIDIEVPLGEFLEIVDLAGRAADLARVAGPARASISRCSSWGHLAGVEPLAQQLPRRRQPKAQGEDVLNAQSRSSFVEDCPTDCSGVNSTSRVEGPRIAGPTGPLNKKHKLFLHID